MTSRSATAALVVLVSLGGACGSTPADEGAVAPTTAPAAPLVGSTLWVDDAAFPVALVATPDGGLLYAERQRGAVRRVGADGVLEPQPVATVATTAADDDQRGLVGLARTSAGGLFAAWTRADDGRLVVGEVGGGDEPRLVWVGPLSARLANGGTLAVDADGRLLVGIGDLERGGDPDDPSQPSRKVLALDPAGPADQTPAVLSTGWNNPFALTVDDQGRPWVADNTGGSGPERIGRADRPPSEAADLSPFTEQRAPAALVPLPGGSLGVCGYLSGRLDEVVVDGVDASGATVTGRVITSPCQIGATRLADGRLVTATPEALFVTEGAVP